MFPSVGFTGTQLGMTQMQEEKVKELLDYFHPTHVHHGDCVGADSQFHDMALASPHVTDIIVHPPISLTKRAFTLRRKCPDRITLHSCKPAEYLERNRHIVTDCMIIIAVPHEFHEVLRSGTWSTIRFTRKSPNRVLRIVYPDGIVGVE